MLPSAIPHRERRCLSSSQCSTCSTNIELEINDVRMSTVDCQLSTQTNVSVSVQPLGIHQQQPRQLQPKQQTSVAPDEKVINHKHNNQHTYYHTLHVILFTFHSITVSYCHVAFRISPVLSRQDTPKKTSSSLRHQLDLSGTSS